MGRVTNSSGRWDASGNIHDAVASQEVAACEWALGLDRATLCLALDEMMDTNAFTLYERQAILLAAIVALKETDGS